MTAVLLLAEQLRRRVPGGIGTYVRGLVQGLAALGHEGAQGPAVTLYASRSRGGPDALAGFGRPVRTSVLPGPLLTRGWDVGVLDVPGGYPVVHATSLATPPARRAALAVTVHDLAWRAVPEAYPRRGVRWHEAALGRVLRRATAVVVPADTVRDEVLAAGAPAAAVRVLPWGCDHLPPPDDAAADALLARLGVHGEFVLSVGTLEPRKNLRRLAEAYASVRRDLPEPWPLVVVGPSGWGADPDGDWGGVPGLVAAGPVDSPVLAALYRRARLLAYVPLREGFGLPPVEAMRSGTPVVASPMPSTAGAALEVDPRDVEAIADGIRRVATDDELRADLSASGRARASTCTWLESARAHAGLWESLA